MCLCVSAFVFLTLCVCVCLSCLVCFYALITPAGKWMHAAQLFCFWTTSSKQMLNLNRRHQAPESCLWRCTIRAAPARRCRRSTPAATRTPLTTMCASAATTCWWCCGTRITSPGRRSTWRCRWSEAPHRGLDEWRRSRTGGRVVCPTVSRNIPNKHVQNVHVGHINI